MRLRMIAALTLIASGLVLGACDDTKATDSKEGAVSEAPKKDEAKKDEGKKEEAKKEEAKGDKGAAKAPAADKATAAINSPAPEFTLKDQDGKEHKLSDYKGKIVVLEWTCPTCPYVVRHYDKDTMAKTYDALGKDDVVWLAVDSSNFAKADDSKAWKTKEGFDYPVLLDADGKVGKLYGAKTTPHMFIIDKEGKLRYNGAIDDDARGKNDKAVNFVQQAVESLKKGEEIKNPENKPYGCSVKYAG